MDEIVKTVPKCTIHIMYREKEGSPLIDTGKREIPLSEVQKWLKY
jgi:hypothetical protein